MSGLSLSLSVVVFLVFFSKKKSEQVGKSSLISTFVSQYFVEDGGVPGLMTRVQLPTMTETHYYFSYPHGRLQQQQQSPPTRRNNNNHNNNNHNFSDDDNDQKTTITTAIVDSQQGDVAFLPQPVRATSTSTGSSGATSTTTVVVAPPKQVDSILLVSDLSRPDTLTRLEQHWLPLLEQAYQGKVSKTKTYQGTLVVQDVVVVVLEVCSYC